MSPFAAALFGVAVAGPAGASAPAASAPAAAAAAGERPPPIAQATGKKLDLFAVATGDDRELTRGLSRAFGSILGHPESIEVELGPGTPAERLRGFFRRVAVRFRGGAFDKLAVEEATLEARDVQFDLRGLLTGEDAEPRLVGETRLSVRLTEEAINDVITRTQGGLGVRRPRLTVEEDRIRFTGAVRMLFLDSPVDLAGRFEVEDGSKIHFRPARLAVSRVRLPGVMVRALADKFNPVVDLSRAPWWKVFRPRLSTLELSDGALTVRTEVDPRGPASVPDLAGDPPGAPATRPAPGRVLRSL